MDRLVVMDKGAIVETGTHARAARAATASMPALWTRQSGGFLGLDDEAERDAAE